MGKLLILDDNVAELGLLASLLDEAGAQPL
jgi:hypothetical protein